MLGLLVVALRRRGAACLVHSARGAEKTPTALASTESTTRSLAGEYIP